MTRNKLLLKLVQKSIDQSFEKGRLNESSIKKFIEIFKKSNLDEAIFCLENYLKLIKQKLAKSEAIVYSASKLSLDEQKRISKKLHATYSILHTTFQTDTSLLGGIKVKIADTVYDNSVSTKIKVVKGIIHG